MATQMAGGKPRFGAIRKFADGGVIKEPPSTSFRGLFNSAKNAISNAMAPESPEAGRARRAREYEAMKAKYGQQPAAQPAQPQPSVQPNVNAGLDGMGGNSIDKRLKESGAYADGGIVKPLGAYRRGGTVKKKSDSVEKQQTLHQEPEGDEPGNMMAPADGDGDEGAKLQGPGTATSDSIDAQIQETGEPIRVANGERILSVDQDRYLKEIAKSMGHPSVDAMLEHGTGKPVGPTIKYAPTKSFGANRQASNPVQKAPTFSCGGKIKHFAWGGAVRGYSNGGYFDPNEGTQQLPITQTATIPAPQTTEQYRLNQIANQQKAQAKQYWDNADVGADQRAIDAREAVLNITSPSLPKKPTATTAPPVSATYPDESQRAPAVNAPAPAAAGALPKPSGVVTTQDRIESDQAISDVMGRKGGDAQFNTNTQKLLNGTAAPNEYKQPNGGGIMAKDAADMNINKLSGDEAARSKVNAAWAQRGAGIQAVSDGKGGLMLTNADGQQKVKYTDTAGNPTNDYTKTQQYAEGMQNRDTLLKSANMTNMDGSTWSTNDNAIMAANIRDGVDPYRGTSKGREDQLRALALSPNGTPGKANAMKMLMMYSDNQERQARGALDRSKLDIDRSKLAIEQAAEGRNAKTFTQHQEVLQAVQGLHKQLAAETDPTRRAQLMDNIQALSGKEPSPVYKTHVIPSTKNADGSTTEGGVYVENTRTGDGRWATQNPNHAPVPQGMVVGASVKESDGTYQAAGRSVTVKNGKITEIK